MSERYVVERVPCSTCSGDTRNPGGGEWSICPSCKGSGVSGDFFGFHVIDTRRPLLHLGGGVGEPIAHMIASALNAHAADAPGPLYSRERLLAKAREEPPAVSCSEDCGWPGGRVDEADWQCTTCGAVNNARSPRCRNCIDDRNASVDRLCPDCGASRDHRMTDAAIRQGIADSGIGDFKIIDVEEETGLLTIKRGDGQLYQLFVTLEADDGE